MKIYMIERYDGLYYIQYHYYGAQEAGKIWPYRRSAELAQKSENSPCEIVEFSLEPVATKCPTCGGRSVYAHGLVECIKTLKAKIEKLTKQRDRAREERNKLLEANIPNDPARGAL